VTENLNFCREALRKAGGSGGSSTPAGKALGAAGLSR
jgi:hypothetical protein